MGVASNAATHKHGEEGWAIESGPRWRERHRLDVVMWGGYSLAHLKGKPTCTLLVPCPVLRPPSCQKGAVALLKGAVVPTGLLCLVKEERPGGRLACDTRQHPPAPQPTNKCRSSVSHH